MNFQKTFPLRYFMNLRTRLDRRLETEWQFENAELEVARFPAIDANWLRSRKGYQTKNKYACGLTKQLIIRRALLSDAEAVFIFEDDIILHSRLQELLANIELPDDWGMFFLGGQHHVPPQGVSPGLVRCRHIVDNHAFGIRRPHYRQLLATLRDNDDSTRYSSDRRIAHLQNEIPTYAAFPNLAWQAKNMSNLTGSVYSSYDSKGNQLGKKDNLIGVAAETLKGKHFSDLGRLSVMDSLSYKGVPSWTYLKDEVRTEKSSEAIKPAFLIYTEEKRSSLQVWDEYLSTTEKDCAYSIYSESPTQPEPYTSAEDLIEENKLNLNSKIRIVHTQLQMLQNALEDKANTHFIFLTDSDIPIKPLTQVIKILRLDPRSRIKRTPPEKTRLAADKLLLKTNLPIPRRCWQFHPKQIILNRRTAKALCEDDFTEHFEKVDQPEKCYIGTVLSMKGFPLETETINKSISWSPNSNKQTTSTKSDESAEQIAANLVCSPHFFINCSATYSNIEAFGLHRS